ncbi:MAG: GNAT family N-acetyltransferase [Pseudomonadota bacterium]
MTGRAPDPHAFAIRAAEARDVGDIVRLADGLSALHGDPRGVFDRRAAERDLFGPRACLGGAVAELQEPGQEGGAVGARVTGFCLWCAGYEVSYAARGAYLCSLYVERTARRRGIGRALIAHAAASVRAEGGVYLWWASAPFNEQGRAFYASFGATDETIHAHALTRGAFDALADAAAHPVAKAR